MASDGATGLVLWATGREVLGRFVEAGGVPLGPVLELAAGRRDHWVTDVLGDPRVEALGDGEYQATWSRHADDTSGHGFFGTLSVETCRVSAATGPGCEVRSLLLGDALLVDGFATAVGSRGEQVVVVDRAETGLWSAVWPADGAPRWHAVARIGNPFAPSFESNVGLADPVLTAAGPDELLVAWRGPDATGAPLGSDLWARRLGPDAAPTGAPFRLNRSAPGAESDPALAVDGSGVLTAIWRGSDTHGGALLGRRLDAAGLPLGSEFRVNLSPLGGRHPPPVASLPDGSSLVAWETPTDDAVVDIHLRAFAASTRDDAGVRPGSPRVRPSTAAP